MRKYIVVVLIALLAVTILILAVERRKQSVKKYDEVRYYDDMAPFSFHGFEPSFVEEVADPSKVKVPTELLKVYLKDGKVVRHDLLSVKKPNKPKLIIIHYYHYDEEGRLSKRLFCNASGISLQAHTVTKRDSEGRPLTVSATHPDTGEAGMRYTYSYDNEGRIIQGAAMTRNNELWFKILFAYDKQGDLLTIKIIKPGNKERVHMGKEAHEFANMLLGM